MFALRCLTRHPHCPIAGATRGNSACPRRESNSQLKDFKSFASAVGLLGLDREVYVLVFQPSCTPVLIIWQLAHLTSHFSSSASS